MKEDIRGLLPLVLRPKDVSEALDVSLDYARQLFHSPGFPSITTSQIQIRSIYHALDQYPRTGLSMLPSMALIIM